MAKKKVRVALIGVGNCASSLVQGVQFYKDTPNDASVPGLMHVDLGGYHVRVATGDSIRAQPTDTCRATILLARPLDLVG